MSVRTFEKIGFYSITGLFVLSILVVVALSWWVQHFILILPAVLVAVVGITRLWREPLLHLGLVLFGFAILLEQTKELHIHEILYGAYFSLYLVTWIITTVLFKDRSIIESPIDALVATFIVYCGFTFFVGLVNGADFGIAIRQLASLSVALIYFPVKSACRDSDRGLKLVLVAFAALAAFILLRNLFWYYEGFSSAERIFEIMYNRKRMNERFLMLGLLTSAALYIVTPRKINRYLFIALAAAYALGIVIGQSRAVWLATGVGFLILFGAADNKQRIGMLQVFGVVIISVVAVGFVFLNDFFLLVVRGLAERVASIGTATERDLSLINRFFEWETAWETIKRSPVIGNGFGVAYEFYDAFVKVTIKKNFIHNTYLGVWYRHGIIGLVLFLGIMGNSIYKSVRFFGAIPRSQVLLRGSVLGALSCLTAILVAAMTESIMLPNDGVFVIFVPVAVIAGVSARLDDQRTG